MKKIGYENPKELVNRPILDQIAPQARPFIAENIRKRNAGEFVPKRYETVGLKKNGEIFEFDVTVDTYSLGGETYTIAIIRDASERKKFENELIEARNKAEEASRTKSVFLANMSHELRTPLNGIIGFSNLLAEIGLSGEQAEFNRMVIDSGHHLLALINDLLDYSRLEANRIKLEKSASIAGRNRHLSHK